MKLCVVFRCVVNIYELEKNYGGSISLALPDSGKPQTYYFLVLNPYAGPGAEMGLYVDQERSRLYAEAVGVGFIGMNPRTTKPMTAYDFSKNKNPERNPVIFVLAQIISEAIYRSEVKLGTGRVEHVAGVPSVTFTHTWEHECTGETEEEYARAFIKAFE